MRLAANQPAPQKGWETDLVWDENFPAFELPQGSKLEDYICRYYDLYYAHLDETAAAWPENVRVFGLDQMTTEAGRREILEFCLPGRAHVDFDAHLNKGS